MKNFSKSKTLQLIGTVVAIAIGIIVLFDRFGKEGRSNESKVSIRNLTPDEIPTVRAEALRGNCDSAYQLGWHHLFISYDESEALDQALSALVKLDPELAKRAELEILLRRQERIRK